MKDEIIRERRVVVVQLESGTPTVGLDPRSGDGGLCNSRRGADAGGVTARSGLLNGLFVFGFFLVLMTIAWQGLNRRAGSTEIGVALGVTAVYLMVFVRMGIPEERTHLIEYGVVAVFIYEALTERVSHGRHVPKPPLIAMAATALLGLIDEGIQAVMPSRVFDPVDIGFNALAAVMAVSASSALSWARQRRSAR